MAGSGYRVHSTDGEADVMKPIVASGILVIAA